MRQFTQQQRNEILTNALNRVNNINILFNKFIEKPNSVSEFNGIKKRNYNWLREKCKGFSTHFFIMQAVNSIFRPPLKFELSDVSNYFPDVENKTLYENFSIDECISFFNKLIDPTIG